MVVFCHIYKNVFCSAGFNFGGLLMPQNTHQAPAMGGQPQAPASASKGNLINDDIDSSLASLAGNLTMGTGKIK